MFSQLYKIVVLIDRAQFTYKARFPSIRDALDYYTQRGRVIEIKECHR